MEKDKTVYNIGQILTYTQDVKTYRALSDTPEIIKKGTKIIVGARWFCKIPGRQHTKVRRRHRSIRL